MISEVLQIVQSYGFHAYRIIKRNPPRRVPDVVLR